MALSGSSRRWFLRNLRQASIVLVCAAVIVGSLIYFVDGSPVRHEITRPQSNGANNEHRYAGSIILPMHGGRCWEAVFDNRTGRMIDKGDVKCDQAAQHLAEKNPVQDFDAIRLRAVGKAFRHEDN
jgi:hypothetical protein